MNQKTITLLFIFFLRVCTAQVPGYYITKENDSVEIKIKPEKVLWTDTINWYKMQKEIDLIDESGKKKELKPSADIREIGFSDNRAQFKMIVFSGKDFYEAKDKKFDADEYKFIRIIVEGKINVYSYYRRDFSNSQQQVSKHTVYHKPKGNIWGELAFFKTKELGKKMFADCKAAMDNLEKNSKISDFHECVLYYNENCK